MSGYFTIANQTGDIIGMNALFNGEGFSGMRFPVQIVAAEEMQSWIQQIQKLSAPLDEKTYIQLLHSSINDKSQFFNGVPKNLFQDVVHLYMNSYGPIHPRENQAKFNYRIN